MGPWAPAPRWRDPPPRGRYTHYTDVANLVKPPGGLRLCSPLSTWLTLRNPGRPSPGPQYLPARPGINASHPALSTGGPGARG